MTCHEARELVSEAKWVVYKLSFLVIYSKWQEVL